MTDDVINYKDQLHWKLEQLKGEIGRAQSEIQQKQEFVSQKQDQVEHVLKLLELEGEHIDRTELDGIMPVSLVEVASKILGQQKKSMHYKDLTDAIQHTKHKIPGRSPEATVIALLHRKKDIFQRLGPGEWGLKEWGLAPKEVPEQKKRKRRARRKVH
jgi:hypothetical protein